MSQISGNLKNCRSRCLLPPSSSLPASWSASLYTAFGVQPEGNDCIIRCPSLLCFPFLSVLFFFLPNHWNNLTKTAKKPDVSVVETSSVPISRGGGLINTKRLFFKMFPSFAFSFHFKICQSSSKIVLLFNIIMFLSKQELIKSIQ